MSFFMSKHPFTSRFLQKIYYYVLENLQATCPKLSEHLSLAAPLRINTGLYVRYVSDALYEYHRKLESIT